MAHASLRPRPLRWPMAVSMPTSEPATPSATGSSTGWRAITSPRSSSASRRAVDRYFATSSRSSRPSCAAAVVAWARGGGLGGFNLHAGVRVEADDRDALERLCRYMARPAVATGRVSVLPDANLAYRVKSPRSAGRPTV